MNENQDEEEDIDFEEETESSEQILEKQKKLEEITLKRTDTSYFKIQNPESLEIMENDKKNVKISLQEGILELLGEKTIKDKEKKDEKKEKDKEKKEKKDEKKDKDKKKEKHKEIKGNYLRREIRTTNFFRCLHLPEDTIPDEIDASFKNGILRLIIPKKLAGISGKKVIEIK